MKIQVDIEQLRKQKIFVATPMYGGQCAGIYTKSVTDLGMYAEQRKFPIIFHYLFNESLITRARNYHTDEFLRSDCTHLLFIDSDIGFNPNDVYALLALQMHDPEKYDVITGPYPKKTISWEKVASAVRGGFADENPFHLENFVGDYVFNPVEGTTSFRIDEPLEVLEAGTGFMLIPRATFEKYAKAYPELSYLPDHIRSEHFDGTREIHAFFDAVIDPKTRRYLSEDYMFCQNVRNIGMKVWMCPWMQLKHMGSYIFGGSVSALAAIQASPTANHTASQRTYKKDPALVDGKPSRKDKRPPAPDPVPLKPKKIKRRKVVKKTPPKTPPQ